MTLPSENFAKNKYMVSRDFLDKNTCKELSDHLINITKEINEGDVQCPLSPSIYGDPVFDTLLEKVRPEIEKLTGLSLLPTYSYARLYKPDDELKPHIDRKQCEISATITLGYDGKLWPIWTSESTDPTDNPKSFDIEIGDILLYRGMEINHWRKPYKEGKRQCQVFLHYVDANGKYADFVYDKREKLNLIEEHNAGTMEIKLEESSQHQGTMQISVEMPTQESNTLLQYDDSYWYFGSRQENKWSHVYKENILPDSAIDLITEYGTPKTLEATIGYGSPERVVNKKIRNANVTGIRPDSFEWLYRMIEKEIYKVNMENYKYVLDKLENMIYIEYHGDINEPGKYRKHTDGVIHKTRKLSFSILLSDPSEYEGGDLLIWTCDNFETMPKKKGSIAFFPAYVEHEVTPVTKGTRRSLVGWIHGPHFA